jgi:hypothetical protein
VLLSGGYTSNATQSAPQDVAAGREQTGSPLLSLDIVGRLEPWISRLARPVGEIRLKGFSPLKESTRGLSYLNLGARAGGELGRTDASRARLLYSYELLGISDKGWYTEAHRAELELDIFSWYQVFGGVGRRFFEHLPRTRTEVDMGIAVVFPFKGGWNLTGIAAWRAQIARDEAFDDRGITGLLRARVPLPWGAMIKLRAMALYDYYLYSEKYYGKVRRDILLKAEAGPWTPDFYGFRLGVTYTGARRISTIDMIVDNFNYKDHRGLLQLRWRGSFNPALPGRADVGDDHIPLPYGQEDARDSGLDRVQDLLRQEESARRGSMCVD